MKINRKILLTALETVKPGLASKEMIEQGTSFCFKKGTILTYNDEISVSYPFEGLEIEGAVNALDLYEFVNKLKSEEVDLEVKDNELLLKAGRAKAGLTLHSEIKLPIEEIGKINKWGELPENFLKALKFTMGCCSKDMSRPILTCVHVNKSVLEATDNYRIATYKLENKVPIPVFLFPANTCNKIIKMEPIEIAEGKGWVHFRTKAKVVISCRIFDDKFPQVQEILNVKGTKIEFPKSIIAILDRAGIFAKRDFDLDESITLSLKENKIIISSKSDVGWFEEKAKITYTGDPITFSVIPYLLKDILDQTNIGIVTDKILLFKGKYWKYLTMLKT